MPGLWSCDKVQESMGGDKHIRSWVQTGILIGRQILLREWKAEGVLSVQEWSARMARVAAFKKMSYWKMDVHLRICNKYVTFLEGS